MKESRWSWFRERWWEFRVADSTYGRYPIAFIQWIVTVYALAILRYSILEAIFTSILIFAASFMFTYVPIMTVVGHFFHRKKQLPTDIKIATEENPYLRKAIPKSKEIWVSLPLAKLAINLDLALAQAFFEEFGREILTKEQIAEFKRLEKLIDALINGEVITAD